MRRLKNSDWYGLGLSVFIHAALALFFAMMSIGATEEFNFGYIEVEMGPLAEGRPVQRTAESTPIDEEMQPEPERRPQPDEQAAPPETAKPVDLPDQPDNILDEEHVATPETETISPVTESAPSDVRRREPTPERRTVQPLGGGQPDGTTGPAQGDEGTGADEQKTAPFQIEGLNRRLVYGPLPDYSDKVNATIQYRITVDPQGRIVAMQPVIKANPALEHSIQEALRGWRFNPLPANATGLNQTGTVTFRFRLE